MRQTSFKPYFSCYQLKLKPYSSSARAVDCFTSHLHLHLRHHQTHPSIHLCGPFDRGATPEFSSQRRRSLPAWRRSCHPRQAPMCHPCLRSRHRSSSSSTFTRLTSYFMPCSSCPRLTSFKNVSHLINCRLHHPPCDLSASRRFLAPR